MLLEALPLQLLACRSTSIVFVMQSKLWMCFIEKNSERVYLDRSRNSTYLACNMVPIHPIWVAITYSFKSHLRRCIDFKPHNIELKSTQQQLTRKLSSYLQITISVLLPYNDKASILQQLFLYYKRKNGKA